jgi:antitoxin component YwqK of YwqJK toxin-antitoxin module
MKLRALIIIIILFMAVFAWWAWPRSHTLSVSLYCTGHYRGFGVAGAEGPILGKRYYRITVNIPGEWYSKVEYKRAGYNDFKRFYPNGTLAEEGQCMVKPYNSPEPMPNHHDLLSSKCYKPDGALCSEVRNGTGTQMFWSPDGVKTGEVVLADFKRVRLSMWYPNGQPRLTYNYVDGLIGGRFVSYYRSGAKETEGAYLKGDPIGKWIWYNEDGGISKTEDYTTPSKKPAEMPAD